MSLYVMVLCIVILAFLVHSSAFQLNSRYSIRSNIPSLSTTKNFRSKLSGNGIYMQTTTTKPPIVESFGKGLMKDIKNKIPTLKSDITDGLSIKSMSATCFLFFACLAPAVAFGGLLAAATGGAMGTMETVGATALGGMIYAAFSGQPLTIIGTTGPLLAFVKVVHSTCVRRGLPFLPVYSWIGLWSALFLYISAFTSTSNVVEYFTRFTDDIFSSLISVIFIVEAISTLAGNFANPLTSGLLASSSVLVALTTYFTTMRLKALRKTSLLGRKIRNLISDFAPTIGVGTGIGVSKLIDNAYLASFPKLAIPDIVGTTSGRPWLVDIMSVPMNIRLGCAIPAIMATILLFMDQNITVRLVMSKQNKLKKSSGLHLDMLVIALVTTITSLLGMPWMVAATVRSLAHVRALQQYQGDGASASVTGVQEQRVSGFAIHALIGMAVLAGRPLLRSIPLPVLTGLFLYLGMSSIDTTELWDRSKMLISDSRDIPITAPGMKSAGLGKTNWFTLVQIALLGGMFWVKNTKLGVFFPVLVGLLPPIRILMEKSGWFSSSELAGLDGELD